MRIIDHIFWEEYQPCAESYTSERLLRLGADEIDLSNSVRDADWSGDPIVPIVCEICLSGYCGPMGLAHVARTDSQLVWMPPYFCNNEFLQPDWDQIDADQMISDSLVIPRDEWDRATAEHTVVPEYESFPRLTDHDWIHLWKQNIPAFAKPGQYDSFLSHFRSHCVAAHPWKRDEVIAAIEALDWQLSQPPVVLEGDIRRIEYDSENYVTCYFEFDGLPEWTMFEADGQRRPIIDGAFLLGPSGC